MDTALVYCRVQVCEVEREEDDGEDADHEGEESPGKVREEVVATGEAHHVLQPLSVHVSAEVGLQHHGAVHLLHVDRLEQSQHEGSVHHDEDSGNEEQDEGIVEDDGGEIGLVGAIFLDKVSLQS